MVREVLLLWCLQALVTPGDGLVDSSFRFGMRQMGSIAGTTLIRMLKLDSGIESSAVDIEQPSTFHVLGTKVGDGLPGYLAAVLLTFALVHVPPVSPCWATEPAIGWDSATQRLKACSVKSNCVSSNFNEPPNRYISPLRTVAGRQVAFDRAVKDLTSNSNKASFSVIEVRPKDFYIHLSTPGTSPGSLDDIEITFTDDDIANVRCEARTTLPPPPFCLQKNCINGNMDQRRRIEAVSSTVLGLPPVDFQRMKEESKWSPIFFNSDRVPDMVDYDDFE